ncbi:MAG: DedA family protein [Candidatus Nanoarchaeia archaeon]|nr:DedA family protein [Candidatus Nanoarchaeia archaeon]
MIKEFIDIILHIDKYLSIIISQYGFLTYFLLFFIIFIETGLVFTPFLPGDSLLFAAGTFAAIGSLNIILLLVIFCIAAVLGDTINYSIGKYFGKKLFSSNIINKKYYEETKDFYKKYGTKTIVIARFIPIVRTFAPFIAGIGNMNYVKFLSYNIIGGICWVSLFTLLGYFFGGIQFVKDNFSLVIIAIIILSFIPIIIEYIKHRRK